MMCLTIEFEYVQCTMCLKIASFYFFIVAQDTTVTPTWLETSTTKRPPTTITTPFSTITLSKSIIIINLLHIAACINKKGLPSY